MGFRNPITTLSAADITAGTLPAGVVLPAAQVSAGALDLLVIARALANGTVTGPAIAAGAVTAAKIAADTITAAQIAAGAIGVAELAAGAVTADKIDARAITATKIGVGVLGTNLLPNPGFEDTGQAFPTPGTFATVPGWTIVQGPAGANVRYGDPGAFRAAAGNGCVLMSYGSSIFNTVPVTPGAGYSYRAAARVKTAYGAAGYQVLIAVWRSFDGGATWPGVDYTIADVPAGYAEVGYTAGTVLTGTTHLRFEVRAHVGNTGDYMLVDDCTLIRIGSPAVEITPGGIRMWDSTGKETVSLNGDGGIITGKILNGVKIDATSYIDVGNARLSGYGTDLNCAGGFRTTGDSSLGLVSMYLTSTTQPANIYSSGSGATLARVSSLRRFKVDREPIGLHPELLDLPPMTWRDAAEVAADPDTSHRVPGFVAEDVQDVSAAHGDSLEPLLTRDEDGALQGLAYDRIVAYLLPIVAELRERVLTLEGSAR